MIIALAPGRGTQRQRIGARCGLGHAERLQAEFAARETIPYPLLSDEGLELARALRLPTFEAGGLTLYKRVTLVAREGAIEHAFYPIFPPDQNAADVLDWLAGAA